MAIKGIGMLRAFQPVYDKIRGWCGDYLVADLQDISGKDNVDEDPDWIDSTKGERDDQNGVDRLANNGGTDGASPEFAPIGEELEPGHGVGVCELASPKSDEAGSEDARDKAEDRGKGLLIFPSGCRGQGDDDSPDEIEERGAEKAQPDGATGGSETVDLGEDVSKDVGDGEQENGPTDREGADGPPGYRDRPEETYLLRDEVRNQENDYECSRESVEIFVTAKSRWDCRFNRVKL